MLGPMTGQVNANVGTRTCIVEAAKRHGASARAELGRQVVDVWTLRATGTVEERNGSWQCGEPFSDRGFIQRG